MTHNSQHMISACLHANFGPLDMGQCGTYSAVIDVGASSPTASHARGAEA